MRRNAYNIRKIDSPFSGINNTREASEINDTDMYDCRNISVSSKGIRSSETFSEYGDQPSGIVWGIFSGVFQNGNEIVVRQLGDKLQYDSVGDGSFVDCTLPAVGSPATTVVLTAQKCSFAMLNDIILWSNGTESVMSSTDGITWTERATLPKAKKLFNNGLNRILFTRVPTLGAVIYWSDINDPFTVGVSSFQYINKNDGQNIEDIAGTPDGNSIVFKSNSVYVISDITLNTLSVNKIGEAGCVPNTAVYTENSAVWLSTDGKVYQYQGGVSVISEQLRPIDMTKAENYEAVYFDRKYRLTVAEEGSDYNNLEIVIDRTMGTNNPLNPYPITLNEREYNCYCVSTRASGQVLFIGGSHGYSTGSPASTVYDFGTLNPSVPEDDISNTIRGLKQTCYFETKFFTEATTFFLKRYVKLISASIINDTTTFKVKYRYAPVGAWFERQITVSPQDLDLIYDDLDTGGFSEGYSFSYRGFAKANADMETDDLVRRGVQVRMEWESTKPVVILETALKYLQKGFFV